MIGIRETASLLCQRMAQTVSEMSMMCYTKPLGAAVNRRHHACIPKNIEEISCSKSAQGVVLQLLEESTRQICLPRKRCWLFLDMLVPVAPCLPAKNFRSKSFCNSS